MGRQKGFSLIELLIVVAIILIIAGIAIPNLWKARIAANQAAGIGSVRTINTSEATYSTTYAGAGYAPDLKTLGPNGADCTNPISVTSTSACLIDGVLGCASATCNKNWYGYTITSSAPTATPVPDYFITAISLTKTAATQDYCSNTDAVVRFQPTTGSGIADPKTCSALPAIQ
jgi:type IV pilus assembly protein PilA